MTTRCHNECGFTLIELLMAMLIFAVGLLGIMSMQLTSISSNSHADTLMVAAALAPSALEDTLALPAVSPLFDANAANVLIENRTVVGAGTLSVRRSITIDTPAPGVVRVDITVTAPNGRRVSVTGYKRSA